MPTLQIDLPQTPDRPSPIRRLAKIRKIYVYASDNSMHVQRLVQGAAAYARLQTPHLRLAWGNSMLTPEAVAFNKIDGAIIFALKEGEEAELGQLGLPAVNVSSRNLPCPYASVTPDDEAIGRMAARHFKENLFENFAFVGLKAHTYSLARGTAFSEGIFPSDSRNFWLDPYPDPAEAHEAIKEFLLGLPLPTALLASNDIFARRICEIAVEENLAVPEQLAILGVDAEQMVSLSSPVELSSVDIDSFRIGFKAAEILDSLMRDPGAERPQITLPPKGIMVAASTDHLASSDPVVTKAVSLIREHACGGLTVDDLAESLGVGRRMLERRFRKALHYGVDELIRRNRIDRATELLDRSELSISEIADHCGFSDIFHFSKIFKKAVGKSPKAYRQGHV